MGKNMLLQYYVEGECEQNFLHTFMHAESGEVCFRPGRIERLNPVAERISPVKAMTIKKGTAVALVFDTDVENITILEENVRTLKRVAGLSDKDIFFLMSVKRFEDELVFACSGVKNLKALMSQFGSRGIKDFKTALCNCRNLEGKLRPLGFDLKQMWVRPAEKPFDRFSNDGKLMTTNRKG